MFESFSPWLGCRCLLTVACDGARPDSSATECDRGALCAACDGGVCTADGGRNASESDCSDGRFRAGGDSGADPSAQCLPWTSCMAGERVSREGNATEDRECQACPEETYSDALDSPECRAWTVCKPGQFQSTKPSARHDGVCSACAAGTYCAGGSAEREVCTFDDDHYPTAPCIVPVHISAGSHHTCFVDTRGLVTCWGSDEGAQPPSGLAHVVQVSAGAGHSCALDDAGAVTCWGYVDGGHASVPQDLGRIRASQRRCERQRRPRRRRSRHLLGGRLPRPVMRGELRHEER
jgi:hypothetical protein